MYILIVSAETQRIQIIEMNPKRSSQRHFSHFKKLKEDKDLNIEKDVCCQL